MFAWGVSLSAEECLRISVQPVNRKNEKNEIKLFFCQFLFGMSVLPVLNELFLRKEEGAVVTVFHVVWKKLDVSFLKGCTRSRVGELLPWAYEFLLDIKKASFVRKRLLSSGSSSRTWTYNLVINSHPLCLLSHRGICAESISAEIYIRSLGRGVKRKKWKKRRVASNVLFEEPHYILIGRRVSRMIVVGTFFCDMVLL